jgi:3-methyladenine DNA glycosylase/8-oxoguanine DNA glycosylase
MSRILSTLANKSFLVKAERELSKLDEDMSFLIQRAGPCTLDYSQKNDLFITLARSIIYQQLHGKAAATIFQRLQGLFPRAGLTPRSILRTSDEKIKSAGLSQNKLLALKDLANRTFRDELPSLEDTYSMTDEQIVEELIVVRGIGRWTVEMLLIFRLGRPDILPVGDLGIRKGYMLLKNTHDMPKPAELALAGKVWSPYRSLAAWYLWRATELQW